MFASPPLVGRVRRTAVLRAGAGPPTVARALRSRAVEPTRGMSWRVPRSRARSAANNSAIRWRGDRRPRDGPRLNRSRHAHAVPIRRGIERERRASRKRRRRYGTPAPHAGRFARVRWLLRKPHVVIARPRPSDRSVSFGAQPERAHPILLCIFAASPARASPPRPPFPASSRRR